jgi:hypothetical protein
MSPAILRADAPCATARWNGLNLDEIDEVVGDFGRIVNAAGSALVLDLGDGDLDGVPLGWTVVRLHRRLLVLSPYMADLLVRETKP